jgi:hypothetical protein
MGRKTKQPEPVTVVPKGTLKSKTIIVNVLMALVALLPGVQDFFVSMGWGTTEIAEAVILVNIALRYMTKGPIDRRLMALRQGFRWMTGRKVK